MLNKKPLIEDLPLMTNVEKFAVKHYLLYYKDISMEEVFDLLLLQKEDTKEWCRWPIYSSMSFPEIAAGISKLIRDIDNFLKKGLSA